MVCPDASFLLGVAHGWRRPLSPSRVEFVFATGLPDEQQVAVISACGPFLVQKNVLIVFELVMFAVPFWSRTTLDNEHLNLDARMSAAVLAEGFRIAWNGFQDQEQDGSGGA